MSTANDCVGDPAILAGASAGEVLEMRVAAGVDLGGTTINYTFVDEKRRFLIEGLFEHPARAKEGPAVCLQQIADGLELAAPRAGVT